MARTSGAASVTSLPELSDVSISEPSYGHLFRYDGSVWSNRLPTVIDAADLNGFVADGTTDNTAVLQAALVALGNNVMPGMKLQNGSGTFQAGADAPGGGMIRIPHGVTIASNLLLSHRSALIGIGRGSILRQKASSTGPLVSNRRDGSVHAKYCVITDLTIDGNKANQSSANHGILLTGDTENNYTSTLDEDYDENHLVDRVYIFHCKGDGLRMVGSGDNLVANVKIRGCDGIGLYTDQDNYIINVTVGWAGLQGFLIQGDDCRIANCKAWFSGRVTAGSGHGFQIVADSGAMASCSAQDNQAAGFLFDGAYGWNATGLMADSNSLDHDGTYPGLDVWNSAFNHISITCRNRYNGGGGAGRQSTAVRLRGGSTDNSIIAMPAGGVWGTTVPISTDSVITGSGIKNDVKLGAAQSAVRAVSADTTVLVNERQIRVDASAAPRTVTLPSASVGLPDGYVIVKTDGSGNAVTVAAASTQTVNGAASFTLTTQYAVAHVIPASASDWLRV